MTGTLQDKFAALRRVQTDYLKLKEIEPKPAVPASPLLRRIAQAEAAKREAGK